MSPKAMGVCSDWALAVTPDVTGKRPMEVVRCGQDQPAIDSWEGTRKWDDHCGAM